MSDKKRAVGLLVMTELPNYGLVAVLQRRGEFNHEKMGPESWPGGLQLTVWGGVKENETLFYALFREISEEMGWHLWKDIRIRIGEFKSVGLEMEKEEFKDGLGGLREIYRFEDEKSLKVAFGIKLPCDFLAEQVNPDNEIRLNASSGGIRLLKEEEIDKIQNLKNFDKVAGVTDRNVLAMFTDVKEAIQRAFTLCGK